MITDPAELDDTTPAEAKLAVAEAKLLVAEERLLVVVLELCGGIQAWTLADDRFGEGRTLRELTDREPESFATIQRTTDRVWSLAERHKITPRHWRRYPRGRNPRRAIIYTGDSPDRAATGKRRGHTGQAIVK